MRLVLVTILLVGVVASTAVAEVSFYWGKNGAKQAFSAEYGTSDDSGTAMVFFIHSYGNAKIQLKQTKGSASEMTYSLQILEPLFGDGAEEWGKYEIEICHAETKKITTYQWDETYFNSSFTVKLQESGDYYVHVRPYTQAEMRNSTNVTKMFGAWNKYPKWWIESKRNCTVSTTSPFSNPSPPSSGGNTTIQQQPKYAKVKIVYKLTNGSILRTDEKSFAPGTHYIHNEYPMDDSLELVGSKYHCVEVYSDGTVSDSTVEFILKWDALENKNNQSNSSNDSDNSHVTVDPPVSNGGYTGSGVVQIIGEYCRIDDPGANVRSGPGTEYEKIGTAPNNGYYRIVNYDRVNTKKDWYQIDRDGLYCWIYSDLVDLNGNLDGTQDGVPMGIISGTTGGTTGGGTSSPWPIGATGYIPDNGNNIRSGPSRDYNVVAVANKGATFVILDYILDDTSSKPTNRDWYYVEYARDCYGWIASGVVDIGSYTQGTINGQPVY